MTTPTVTDPQGPNPAEALLQATARTPPADLTTPEAAAEAVRQWAARLHAVRLATGPGDHLDTYFRARRAEREATHRIDGLLVAPAAAFDQLEQRDREQFDANVQAESAALLAEADTLSAALDRLAAAAHDLRPPRPASLEGRALTRTAELLEREEARRQFDARPLAALERAYLAATDDEAGAFVAFVEAEVLGGFQTLTPRTSEPADQDALRRLVAAMRDRRAARVPLLVREQRARLDAVWTQTTRSWVRSLRAARLAADRFAGRAAETPRG